ncbi:MAG: hypothetical protein GY861_23270 [bacterium]|nr:hypothetical protein [bacterium]
MCYIICLMNFVENGRVKLRWVIATGLFAVVICNLFLWTGADTIEKRLIVNGVALVAVISGIWIGLKRNK